MHKVGAPASRLKPAILATCAHYSERIQTADARGLTEGPSLCHRTPLHSIPGDAELALALDSGAAVPTEDTPWIHAALAHIPRSRASDLHLVVGGNSDSLLLKIQPEPGISLDLVDRAVFPATPDCVAPSALIEFKRVGAHWLAEVPKGEFAPTPLRGLRLVFAEKAGCAPFSLTWKNP